MGKETMLATLNHLQTHYGGAAGYLAACALNQTTLTQLRARLLAS